MFIPVVIGCYRLWLGVAVLMPRHLHAQYCPGRSQSHTYTISPRFSILVFSTLGSHCSVAPRHARRASAGLLPTHSNGCVALTPFQPTACICIPLCINLFCRLFCRHCGSVRTPIVARSLPLYLRCTCLYTVLKLVTYV